MRTISNLDLLVNRDWLNQMHCRTMQLLAMAGRCTPAVDLLMYRALEPTHDIHHHCHARQEDRWSYPCHYVNEEDLGLLGLAVDSTPKVDLADAAAFLRAAIDADRPVSFYAPRGHFDFWVDRMRRDGTRPDEYFLLHSFMCCGITADAREVLIVDTTSAGNLHPFVVAFDVFTSAYPADPDRWFLICQSLRQFRATPDVGAIETRYIDWLDGFRDGFEVYDVIADSFAGERDRFPEWYRRPSLNSLVLLAGSRDFFRRFLAHTTHDAGIVSAFAANADLLVTLLDETTRLQNGMSATSADELRGMLAAMKSRERQALRALQTDLRRLTAGRRSGRLLRPSGDRNGDTR
ncbi:MAG TPA: hypothetical protein VGR06_24780 [Actinophytocola sp.]|jgi:hypothetical protein|uniref:hypothetical protein n=1 Tax=Actinophytocola sp. TaxID=1872138 RepID=UPI002E094C91|nr:hypothetical protein [Actinophytocola sp.]